MKVFIPFLLALFLLSCNKNESLNISKIVFHTSDYNCWGLCPIYHLEINKDGNSRLHIEKFNQYDSTSFKTNFEITKEVPDSNKIGFYSGKLNQNKLKFINDFIIQNKIDTVKNTKNKMKCFDGPTFHFIINYENNTRKEISYNCSNNEVLDSLSNLLLEVVENNDFKKIEKSFFIEDINIR